MHAVRRIAATFVLLATVSASLPALADHCSAADMPGATADMHAQHRAQVDDHEATRYSDACQCGDDCIVACASGGASALLQEWSGPGNVTFPAGLSHRGPGRVVTERPPDPLYRPPIA